MTEVHKGITDKQWRFIEEYLTDNNATQAALRAGYSKKGATTSALRLLSYDYIAKIIAERKAEIAAKHDITRGEIIKGLRDIIDQKKSSSSAKVSAWALIAKITGNIIETRKITHEGEIKHKHGLSDDVQERLASIYNKATKKVAPAGDKKLSIVDNI